MALLPVNTFIIISRENFYLSLFKRPWYSSKFNRIKVYRIAVGTDEYSTPVGVYSILKRAKNPDWLMPNSPWIDEEFRGQVIPGGDPANPIKSRWLEIYQGVGIHGTWDIESIGTEASHGCIRMRVNDIKELYPLVPKGSIVYIN